MKKKNLIASGLVFLSTTSLIADHGIMVFQEEGQGVFQVKGAPVIYDGRDFTVVQNTVKMLKEDIEMLTGESPGLLSSGNNITVPSIIVGTIGYSSIVDSLANVNAINVDDIKGNPERFKILTIEDGKGNNCLVIAGSDRRGTAFGVTTLSRELGVDPWVWWADVPVKFQPEISLTADYTSTEPSEWLCFFAH